MRKQLRTFLKDFETTILSFADQFEKLLHDNDLQLENLTGGSRGVAVFLNDFRRWSLAMPEIQNSGKPFLSQVNGLQESWINHKKKQSRPLKNQLESLMSTIHEKLDENLPRYSLYRLLDAEILSFALQQRLLDQLDEMSAQSNQVHISEFNKRLASAIDDAAVPYIYERLGERF